MKKLKAGVCAVTHAGSVRTDNQDNLVLNGRSTATGELNKGAAYMQNVYEPFYLAVCDGMGGEMCGELASKIGCQSIMNHARAVLDGGDDFGAPLAACLREANQSICDEITKRGTRIGTTVAAVYAMKGKIVCVNVGDSRVYRFSDGKLEQLSVDHTYGQSVIDAGAVAPDKGRNIPNATNLTRHLGIFPDESPLSPSVCVIDDAQEGDVLLLCSDGLTDLVSDDAIADMLATCDNAQEAASRLVKAALRNGGKDNVTVIAAFLKVEQTEGFIPKAKNVIGATDADYSEEYQANYGKVADRNAALAALKEDAEEDEDDNSAGAKKIMFMAGVVLLSAALMVLVAFGVKSLLSKRNGSDNTTLSQAPVTLSTTAYQVSSLTTTEFLDMTETETDTEETETEESSAEEVQSSTTYRTTKRTTTKATTKKTTKATAKSTTKSTTKATTKATTGATEPQEVTDATTTEKTTESTTVSTTEKAEESTTAQENKAD